MPPVETLAERVYQLFGRQMLEEMIEMPPVSAPIRAAITEPELEDAERAAEISVRGFISRPEVQRANRNGIYVFVNRRLVRDRAAAARHSRGLPQYSAGRRVSGGAAVCGSAERGGGRERPSRRRSKCASGIRNSCTISRATRCGRRLAARGRFRALPAATGIRRQRHPWQPRAAGCRRCGAPGADGARRAR